MAKKNGWKPSPAAVRQQNAVKARLLEMLEKAGNDDQPVNRSQVSADQLREIRRRGIPGVFNNVDVASKVFADGSKLAARILNGMKDEPSVEGFIQAVNTRKIAGETVDIVGTLQHLEEDAIDRGIFDSAVDFHRYLENGGKGLARIANAINEGEITDVQALDRLNDQVVNSIRKEAMSFSFL